MLRVTFTTTPVVWIEILGEPHPENRHYARNDGGLVHRFMQWATANEIYEVRHVPSRSGAGAFSAAFAPHDAERVLEWLRANAAVQSDP